MIAFSSLATTCCQQPSEHCIMSFLVAWEGAEKNIRMYESIYLYILYICACVCVDFRLNIIHTLTCAGVAWRCIDNALSGSQTWRQTNTRPLRMHMNVCVRKCVLVHLPIAATRVTCAPLLLRLPFQHFFFFCCFKFPICHWQRKQHQRQQQTVRHRCVCV